MRVIISVLLTSVNGNETSNVEGSKLVDSIVDSGLFIDGVIDGFVSTSGKSVFGGHGLFDTEETDSWCANAGCGTEGDARQHG